MNDHVTEIVRYDDHRSSIRNRILFHKPTQNSPDEGRGCSMYTGHEKIFDMVDLVKGRTNNSEGTGGTWMYQSKRKKEPKTNNRLCHVFVLGSYWRRWGNAIHVHNSSLPA